ncbi:MAG: SRPBCC family protein [Bacteroidota bacterium]
MNVFFRISSLLITAVVLTSTVGAQTATRNHKVLYVERTINAPAERVWQALAGDYGEISNFSPSIFTSSYENGSLQGAEGAERICAFNASGSRWTHEQIRSFDPENMTMSNVVLEAGKFPLDTENAFAIYQVRDNGDGTSTASYEFHFRTKPAFMAGLAKGSFKRLLNETLIGLEHYLTTGEIVNGKSDNWRAVRRAYKDRGAYRDFVFHWEAVKV